MVYACPAESDPRDKLEDFVRNPEFRIITGLRGGLQVLIDLITGEIKRQEPISRIIFVDRGVLSDNEIDFSKDIEKYFNRVIADGGKVNFLLCDDIPVVDWQSAVSKLRGRNAQVYCFSVACKQIPTCSKLI